MKKTFALIVSLVLALCMLISVPLGASAAETASKDGIDVTITTSKDTYKPDDTIRVSIKIKNNNDFSVSGINVSTLLPEDFVFEDEADAQKTIDLEDGEMRILSAKVNYTGKDNFSLLLIILCILAAVIMIIIIVCIIVIINKKKPPQRMMSIILCLVLSLSFLPFGLFAVSGESAKVTVDKTISINKKDFTIQATAEFTAEDLSNTVFANLAASEQFFVCNEEGNITVTASLKKQVSTVELYDHESKKIGDMHDNGLDGDLVAGDNIYSLNVNVFETSETKLDFFAKADGQKSQKLSVYYFGTPDEADRTAYENAATEIENIESEHIGANDTVEEGQAAPLLADVFEFAEKLLETLIIVDLELTDTSIYMKFASGLTYVYAPKMTGTYSIGSNERMSVSVYQPYYSWVSGISSSNNYISLPAGIGNEADLLAAAGNAISGTFANYSFAPSNIQTNNAVSLESIDRFGPNQIILWQGHGTWAGSKLHSIVMTGKSFDWNAWLWDLFYFTDCCKGRIINANGHESFSSKYIDKYCENLNNSFIYLGPCQSAYDDVLVNSFLNKGAAAVIANTDTILCRYGDMIEYTVAHLLTQVNPATNNYYTLGEALVKAKSTYGESDATHGGKGAIPTLFGGNNAYDYRLGDLPEPVPETTTVPTTVPSTAPSTLPDTPSNGTLSGRICKASDRSTAVAGATVSIYSGSNYLGATNADSSGNYSVSLPAGNYIVKITSSGYVEFKSYVTVTANSTTYTETFLMVQGSASQSGTASGQVINSLTGSGLSGVSLVFKKDWNNTSTSASTVGRATTDSNGNYSVNLPLGNYTAIASKDGYSTSSFNIIVQSGTTENQNGTITPVLSGDDYLITLTWDETPRDIDSHVYGHTSDGSAFHVYYNSQYAYDGSQTICNLDYDDTSSFGPEHITLVPTSDGAYYYYVHNYSQEAPLNTSGAKVTVERGNTVIAEFNMPTNVGDGYCWNVFAIKDGELIVENTVTDSPDTSYAG